MTEQQHPRYAEQLKGKTGAKRVFNAFFYSLDGIRAACTESAFRQLLLLHSILILIAFFYPSSTSEKMILIFASFFSLIVELFNTGIEAAVDHTSLDQHPLAKRAKDVGSAAQLMGLILCGILWAMIIFR